MPDYAAALLALIDSRIRGSLAVPTKMGTVVTRETATALATVALDGSSGVPQPVKCFETTVIDLGDRVGLVKFEGDWVVVANYTPRMWADGLFGTQFGTTGTTTSSSFADLPGSPKVNVTKMRDVTQFQIEITVSAQSTAVSTSIEVAANILSTDGTVNTDLALYTASFDTASVHRTLKGGLTTALTLPGGGYSVVGRWRRSAGTGTPTINTNDNVMIRVREVLG